MILVMQSKASTFLDKTLLHAVERIPYCKVLRVNSHHFESRPDVQVYKEAKIDLDPLPYGIGDLIWILKMVTLHTNIQLC